MTEEPEVSVARLEGRLASSEVALAQHLADCRERYREIAAGHRELRGSLEALGDEVKASLGRLQARIDDRLEADRGAGPRIYPPAILLLPGLPGTLFARAMGWW